MQRQVETTIAASDDAVAAAIDALDGSPARGVPADDAVVDVWRADHRIVVRVSTAAHVPWFGWFFHPPLRIALRRSARDAAARLDALAQGGGEPAPPKVPKLLPPSSFSLAQITMLGSLCALVAAANYGGSLIGQNTDFVANAFGASDRALANGLAVTRIGVLVSLVAATLADRRGRRLILLTAVSGVALSSLVAALAPTLVVFVGAQTFTRGFTSAALTVAAVAAVEEAPEGARAWSVAMMSLAGGAGYAVGVLLLPIGDLTSWSWRLPFGLSALSIFGIPFVARQLVETTRYRDLARRPAPRGRIREIFDSHYRRRFFLLGAIVFLTAIAATPAAQLTNRFLGDERGFSGTDITVFRAVTNGIPGILGVVIAGRLAERHGRRPLAVIGVTVTTLLNIAFFLGDGWVLWVTSTLAILTAAIGGLAIGTLDHELFPTEVRSTSGGFLTACGVAGAVVGLLLAGALADRFDGFGVALCILAVAPLIAALGLAPFLPESAHRTLDEVSPSEA